MGSKVDYTNFDINYDGYFEEFIGDWRVKVRVYDTTHDLNSTRKVDLPSVDAYMNVIDGDIVMHFSKDCIAMALIVHESIHTMFWCYDRDIWSRPKMKHRKKINIFYHPESMVTFGGNLAAIVWGQVTDLFPEVK